MGRREALLVLSGGQESLAEGAGESGGRRGNMMQSVASWQVLAM